MALDWLKRFEDALRVRTRPHTQQAYMRDIRRLMDILETPPESWTPPQIQHALIKLHGSGLSPRTLHRMLSSWRYFFRYLAEHSTVFEVLISAPLKLPRLPQTLPQTLTPDEVQHILDTAASSTVPSVAAAPSSSVENDAEREEENTTADLRAYTLAELLYSSGLRIDEAAHLRWSDIDFDSGLVRVTGKGGKMRDVPLGSKALEALQRWFVQSQAHSGAPLFPNAQGKPMSIRTLQRWIHRLGSESGLNRRFYPHLLRHSFASHMLQSSGDLRAVQEMLGHSSLQATQIYTHLDFQHLSSVYDKAHPRAKQRTDTETLMPDVSPDMPTESSS